MYPPAFRSSLDRLHASRERRLREAWGPFTADQKVELLHEHHPDSRVGGQAQISHGPNGGAWCPVELAQLLGARSLVDPTSVRLDPPDFDVDVLVIGGGGAGAAAALAANDCGARVLLTTKLRIGDSNTIMATGMAASVAADDSPVLHYLDTMGGGHFENVPELVEAMVVDGPAVVEWFEDLGVHFDRDSAGNYVAGAAGGYSRRRTVSSGDLTGLEMIRVLKDEILRRRVDTLDFHPAVELLVDEDRRCAGAILRNLFSGRDLVVRAGAVILTTGGMGRLHCHGFPTSNHFGATADGLIIGYRAGARMSFVDSVQYHPTGVLWPDQMYGWLVSERCRGMGGHLVNSEGDRFVYERETRDAVAAAIIRECAEGRGIETASGHSGVWLDTPVIHALGAELAAQRLAAMHRRFAQFDIDIWREPVLVYPTQHYQNGGLVMDSHGRTTVANLYAAGEVAGGVHGRNRLGGNSLLDVFVFGLRAGRHAATLAEKPGPPTLLHVVESNRRAPACDATSPLLLPRYARRDPRNIVEAGAGPAAGVARV